MKKYSLFLFFAFVLVACASSTPMPTETPIPTITSTLTPVLTSTPTATATPEPWVALAEEYDMPEEIARQVIEMDVNFEENPSPYVDGILVVNNETGEDFLYFDYQTGFWVEVDRWPIITEVGRIRENEMTEEELFSDEYFAWLKYIASTLEFDVEHMKNEEMFRTLIIGKIKGFIYNPLTAPHFDNNEEELGQAPFRRKEALAYVDFSPDAKYVIAPSFLFYKGKIYPVILEAWDLTDPDLDADVSGWESDMRFSPIVTSHPVDDMPPSYPDLLGVKTFDIHGEEIVNGAFDLFEKNGNPADMSQPAMVIRTIMLQITDNRFK